MAFQDPLLLSGTTYDNVAYGLRLRGRTGAAPASGWRRRSASSTSSTSPRQRARTLSGGEAQRTALARALVLSPELLLLDEPFAALDAPIRKHLLEELRQVVRARGITCVYVTHEQAEAFSIADRIAILRRGKLLQAGTPEEVLFRPASRAVARFMQTGNILPGRRRRGGRRRSPRSTVGPRLLFSRTGLPEGTPVDACIRREEILVEAPGEASPAPGLNRFRGTVEAVVDLGSTMQVRHRRRLPGLPAPGPRSRGASRTTSRRGPAARSSRRSRPPPSTSSPAKETRPMTTCSEALRLILDSVAPLPARPTPLFDALGLVLADRRRLPGDGPALHELRDGRLRPPRGRLRRRSARLARLSSTSSRTSPPGASRRTRSVPAPRSGS